MAKKKAESKAKPAVEKKEKITKPKTYAKDYEALHRINKSKYERIFLLSAERSEEEWKFLVQGTKGSNYNVTTGRSVKCSCMDFKLKKKPCKHIYFIVTQVAQDQKTLDYFRDTPTISKAAYNVLDGHLSRRLKSRLEAMNSSTQKKQIDLKDDTDCTICFTQMEKQTEQLQDCPNCKKYFHEQCIKRWKQHNPTCPLCRGALTGGPDSRNPLGKLQKIQV